MFVSTFLHRVLAFACMSRYIYVYIFFSKFSSLFIEELRDVENLAVTSTCPSWSFDSSPLILCLIWYLSYEELNSNPFQNKRNNFCSNVTVIFVLLWRHTLQRRWLQSSWPYTSYTVLCQLWWSSFWWDMLLMFSASDVLASDN